MRYTLPSAFSYGVSKLFAYWITVNYREAYGLYACNGILFNHESPIRGETFVTRKITRGLARVCTGLQHCLYLGNLDARRDWGHARDYVDAMWRMLQQEAPGDYVIASGRQHTVRDFVRVAAAEMAHPRLPWEGAQEYASIAALDARHADRLRVGDVVVRVDPQYFRPAEVDTLCGEGCAGARPPGLAGADLLRRAGARNGAGRSQSSPSAKRRSARCHHGRHLVSPMN